MAVNDDVFLGPASDEEALHVDNDDVFAPESPDQAGEEQVVRGCSSSPRSGRFGAWLVGDSSDPLEPRVLLGVADMQWTLSPRCPGKCL